MGTRGLLVDARESPVTRTFVRAAAAETRPKREPPAPEQLDSVLFRTVSKANDGRVIKVNYNRVEKKRITPRTYSVGFPICDCTSAPVAGVSESGELLPDVIRADALAVFAQPGAWVADEKQGGKDRERWLQKLEEAASNWRYCTYPDVGGNVVIRDWSGVPELTDDNFRHLHQIRWEPSKEDIRRLALQGVVLERQRCDRYLFALVRDGEKAARILVGRKKRPKEYEKRRIARLLAEARMGRIPKGALHAGLYAAKCCLTLASVAANRTAENEEGAERLSGLLAEPEKLFMESAWARVKEWQSLRFGKFDEYKRVCAVARRHASDAATKLACRMWAKSGEKA